MSKNYISNKQEFKNYMLGVAKDLHEKINFTPMTDDEERVTELYTKFMNFVCGDDSRSMLTTSMNMIQPECKGEYR